MLFKLQFQINKATSKSQSDLGIHRIWAVFEKLKLKFILGSEDQGWKKQEGKSHWGSGGE